MNDIRRTSDNPKPFMTVMTDDHHDRRLLFRRICNPAAFNISISRCENRIANPYIHNVWITNPDERFYYHKHLPQVFSRLLGGFRKSLYICSLK